MIFLRLRNVKNKKEILEKTEYLIDKPTECMGNWNKLFKNNNPIHIEVGMGKGQFIIQNAINNPNINYIGIEKYDSIMARAVEKTPDNICNLKFIRLDAINIDEVFDSEVECLYLNFSDPWPKKRHSERRLTSKTFLNKYDKIFKKEKYIVQKTDNQSLFEYSIESLSNYGYTIEKISLNLHSSDIAFNIMTEYEEKFTKENKATYYLVAKKLQ